MANETSKLPIQPQNGQCNFKMVYATSKATWIDQCNLQQIQNNLKSLHQNDPPHSRLQENAIGMSFESILLWYVTGKELRGIGSQNYKKGQIW